MDKREGRNQDLPLKTFCLTVPEKFRRGILYCCIKFLQRKCLWTRRGREYQEIPSKFFCVKVPKNSVGEYFTVAIISVTEKIWIRGGLYRDFPSKIFCLTLPKDSVGESFTVALLSVT